MGFLRDDYIVILSIYCIYKGIIKQAASFCDKDAACNLSGLKMANKRQSYTIICVLLNFHHYAAVV